MSRYRGSSRGFLRHRPSIDAAGFSWHDGAHARDPGMPSFGRRLNSIDGSDSSSGRPAHRAHRRNHVPSQHASGPGVGEPAGSRSSRPRARNRCLRGCRSTGASRTRGPRRCACRRRCAGGPWRLLWHRADCPADRPLLGVTSPQARTGGGSPTRTAAPGSSRKAKGIEMARGGAIGFDACLTLQIPWATPPVDHQRDMRKRLSPRGPPRNPRARMRTPGRKVARNRPLTEQTQGDPQGRPQAWRRSVAGARGV